jgi:isochorismate synthase EntC
MIELNLKDFLTSGAFLQIGPDLFKVLVGPFDRVALKDISRFKQSTVLYRPNFWDFLDKNSEYSQKPVYVSSKSFDLNREEFIHILSSIKSVPIQIQWQKVNEDHFRSQFEWSQNSFANSELTKAVPVIRQLGSVYFSTEQLNWCLQNLLQHKNFGWSYGFFDNFTGYLGHTPEILVQWTKVDRQLHTVALAGTYAKSENAFDEIINDHKVLNEHNIVIDDIIDKLSGLSFKSKSIQGPTDVLELKYLLHLITEFQMEVADVEQVFEVIKALHPTSAMGIYPNNPEKMQQFSEFILQKQREAFAAPFAMVNQDFVYSVVAIRNLFFEPHQVQIFSGCGVTRDSNCEAELLELQNKRNSVKKMLGLNLD